MQDQRASVYFRHICLNLVRRQDGGDIKQAETITLSKICRTSYALVLRDSTLVHTMGGLVNYALTLDLRLIKGSLDESIKDLVNDTLVSEYLPTRTQAAVCDIYG